MPRNRRQNANNTYISKNMIGDKIHITGVIISMSKVVAG